MKASFTLFLLIAAITTLHALKMYNESGNSKPLLVAPGKSIESQVQQRNSLDSVVFDKEFTDKRLMLKIQ